MLFHTNFSESQRRLLRSVFPPLNSRLRKHDTFDILEAIFFIVKTGIQWARLPLGYPPYKTVYYHYRCWGECGDLDLALHVLVCMKREDNGQSREPDTGVVERAFSWLQNYRRLTCNFERYRSTARAMTMFACVFFMLRYF